MGGLALYWCANEATPLGPRTVVVTHLWVTQQVVKDKPGMAAALADAAVSDDFFVRGYALVFVDGTQFIR